MEPQNQNTQPQVKEQGAKKYSPEIQRFYKNFFASHPELLEKVNSQKFVFYLYLILTLIVVSFFGAIVIRPTLLTIFELREEFDDNEEIINKLDDKLDAISSLESQRTLLSEELSLLNEVIPESPQIPQLVRKIENLAVDNGIIISRIEVGAIEVYPNNKTDSPFFTFNFNMNVSGNTENLNSFLSDLIFFDRLISIDRVSGGSVSDGVGEYIIVARTYFYNNNE